LLLQRLGNGADAGIAHAGVRLLLSGTGDFERQDELFWLLSYNYNNAFK